MRVTRVTGSTAFFTSLLQPPLTLLRPAMGWAFLRSACHDNALDRVDFEETPEGVNVKMTISYKLPTALAIMFRGNKSAGEGGPVNAAVKKILLRGMGGSTDSFACMLAGFPSLLPFSSSMSEISDTTFQIWSPSRFVGGFMSLASWSSGLPVLACDAMLFSP